MEKLEEILEILKNINDMYPERGNIVHIDRNLLKLYFEKDDKKDYVEYLQNLCNDLYGDYGFDESILDLQVYINGLRNKYNITDSLEIVNDGFVQ